METLKNIMTKKMFTISVNSTMKEASAFMREHRIRHLPVVDSNLGIVGMLSALDLAAFSRFEDSEVEFFMSAPVIQVHQDARMREGIFKMLENKISAILVSDDEGAAVGIVTTDDLLWLLAQYCEQKSQDEVHLSDRIFDIETVGQVAHRLSLAGI